MSPNTILRSKFNPTAGLYYWAGPGTIRMSRLKYPQTKIDTKSFMHAYDFEVLKKLKNIFNLSDVWVSYSWGFDENVEKEDYEFTEKKLMHFKKLKLRTHAYIQGFNLVYEDYKDKNYFCRDYYGRLIPYQRGRKMTCPNNPFFADYLLQKIKKASKKDFDGIFVDNIYFGQFPIFVGKNKTTFFGCFCEFCQKKFYQKFGFQIPKTFTLGSDLWNAYISFRVESVTSLLEKISKITKKNKKIFGTNSFDPRLESRVIYGTDVEDLQTFQDYVLFENHDLPNQKNTQKNNQHLSQIIAGSRIPILVVSYKQGIGRDNEFSQKDFNAIFSESKKIGYVPCYKGTEFITNGTWHDLRAETLKPVKNIVLNSPAYVPNSLKKLPGEFLLPLYNFLYNPLTTWQFESELGRKLLGPIYYRALQ